MGGQIGAVIRREAGERLSRPGYAITTLLGILVMVAFVVLPSIIAKATHPSLTVGTINVPPAVLLAARPAGISLVVQHYGSVHHALHLIRERNLAGFFRLVHGHLVFYGQVNAGVSALVANLNHRALLAALSPSVTAALARAQAAQGVSVVAVATPAALVVKRIAIYALNIIIMIVVTTYGVFIATSVLEEKESRHAEMLMAWIRPRTLLFGKIIGFGILAFVQVAVWAAAGLIAVSAKSLHGLSVEGFSASFLLMFLLWVVVGYLQFGTAFAALATRAQRTSELNQAVMPMTILVFLGYMGAALALAHPSGILVTVLRVASFVPFLAPMLSLATIQLGNVAWWIVALDALIQIAFWWFLLNQSAAMFRKHLLDYRETFALGRKRFRAGPH